MKKEVDMPINHDCPTCENPIVRCTCVAPDTTEAISNATYAVEKAVAGLSGALPAGVTAKVTGICRVKGRVVVVIDVRDDKAHFSEVSDSERRIK